MNNANNEQNSSINSRGNIPVIEKEEAARATPIKSGSTRKSLQGAIDKGMGNNKSSEKLRATQGWQGFFARMGLPVSPGPKEMAEIKKRNEFRSTMGALHNTIRKKIVNKRGHSPVITVASEKGGVGKLLVHSTLVPTPTGWTTIGNIKPGHAVIGRDGKPCNVKEIFEHENVVVYDLYLSDGQKIRACEDHRWLVSGYYDRINKSQPSRIKALENWNNAQGLAKELITLSNNYDDNVKIKKSEFDEIVLSLNNCIWKTSNSLHNALAKIDFKEKGTEGSFTKTVNTYSTVDFIQALAKQWKLRIDSSRHRNYLKTNTACLEAAQTLIVSDFPDRVTENELHRMLQNIISSDIKVPATLISIARKEKEFIPFKESKTFTFVSRDKSGVPVKEALLGLAELVKNSVSSEQPQIGVIRERVMTTNDMINEGVKVYPGGKETTNFAIRLTEPLDLPESNLIVEPYTFGAWLGDGSTGNGGFTGIDPEITDNIIEDGYKVTHSSTTNKSHYINGIITQLKEINVANNKHIPMEYLRGSFEQRLALLQGLMDTDGYVDENGKCEFTQCKEELSYQVLELIRSLGIKATINSSPATLTEDDHDNPGGKRQRVTGTRWRINFTTTLPVFRLSRKLDRMKAVTRSTQDWVYITDIVPAGRESGKCLVVDSPDHMFLVEGFVPTHNSTTSAVLGWALAEPGKQSVAICEVNPHLGSLANKLGTAKSPCLRDLLLEGRKLGIEEAKRKGEVIQPQNDYYLPPPYIQPYFSALGDYNISVLSGNTSSEKRYPTRLNDVNRIVFSVSQKYNATILDNGTDMDDSGAFEGSLRNSNCYVLVANSNYNESIDVINHTLRRIMVKEQNTKNTLVKHRYNTMRKTAILAIVEQTKPERLITGSNGEIGSKGAVHLAEHFRSHFIDIVIIPYDDELRFAPINFKNMAPETKIAATKLAAACWKQAEANMDFG